MWRVLGVLLIIWLALTLLGAIIKGLLWIAIIGGLLFVGTAIYGWSKKQINR